MSRLILSLCLLIFIAGCSKKEESTAISPSQAVAAKGRESKPTSFLAYEHSLSIDTQEQKVVSIFETAKTACRAASDDFCTILESNINSGRTASASLKFRAKPNGIKKIISALSQKADVTNQSTTAEDLEAPISDAAKKLAMLKDYRAKLETLRNRANNDVDALIKINRELAQVQSDLEALEGTHAHLVRRVETEILNVYIRSDEHQAFWKPIGYAISDFGGNLSHGISISITGVAYLIPWFVLLVIIIVISRKLWHRRKSKTSGA